MTDLSRTRRSSWLPPRLGVAALILAVALSACAQTGRTGPSPDTATPLDGTWELAGGRTGDGTIALVAGYPVTLRVDGRQVSGTSGCNHYGSTLSRDGQRVTFEQPAGTEMACEPDVMSLEQRYLAALAAAETAARRGAQLVLTGPDVVLEFDSVPPPDTADLVGTTWVLESLLRGTTASSTVGEPAELRLRQDGTVRGSTGCRSFRGRYEVRGAEVQLGTLEAGSPGDCRDDVRAQDDQVLEVLGDGFRARVEGGTLTLTSRGDLGLAYRAE